MSRRNQQGAVPFGQEDRSPPLVPTLTLAIDMSDNATWTANVPLSGIAWMMEESPDGLTGWFTLVSGSDALADQPQGCPDTAYYRVTLTSGANAGLVSNVAAAP